LIHCSIVSGLNESTCACVGEGESKRERACREQDASGRSSDGHGRPLRSCVRE
jgi:hypothetical protein